ncbi:MAG: glycosyltransferase family 4 protein [Planctomycetes bacterium]|nr:glycosyltransferase family 4 protein [Planctomycetota bacterium]
MPHLLHVFSTFVPAGPEMRTVNLIHGLPPGWRHTIVAMDGRTSARAELTADAPVAFLDSPPKAGSFATVRRMRALLKEHEPDLVCTYNWGAFDTVVAARTLGRKRILHHEDGFNADETQAYKRRRELFRKIFLPGTARVIVPSQKLAGIARERWKLAAEQLRCIPNGIRFERFAARDGNPQLRAQLGIPLEAPLIGYVGHLRPEKNPARLLRAAARVERELGMHVLVLGDGPERPELERLAASLPALYGHVHFVGHQSDPIPYYRALDLFALSSDTEQMPVALIEAMACALPVVATDVGDVRAMLPDAQGEFVLPLEEHETAWPMAEKLTELLKDREQSAQLGAANRARVEERYTFEAMLAAYREEYERALAR